MDMRSLRWIRVYSLKYGDVITSLFQAIPEAKAAYDRWDMPGEVLPHIVFSLLEESFLTPVIKADKNAELQERIFRFLEQMAISTDNEVVNLLWIGLFEPWAANGTLTIALNRLEPRSKLLAKAGFKEFLKPRKMLG